MKQKFRKNLLAIYRLILAFGAIYIGVLMVNSNSGIFVDYHKEWLSKFPFRSWVTPGIIAIVIFGLGNLIAALLSFGKKAICNGLFHGDKPIIKKNEF